MKSPVIRKMATTKYLFLSGLYEAALSRKLCVLTDTACSLFDVRTRCGRNLNEHNEAPIRLNAAHRPRSFKISDCTSGRQIKPPTVVKLPIVMGADRPLTTALISRVWRK